MIEGELACITPSIFPALHPLSVCFESLLPPGEAGLVDLWLCQAVAEVESRDSLCFLGLCHCPGTSISWFTVPFFLGLSKKMHMRIVVRAPVSLRSFMRHHI